jgi:hypothetical protein
VKPNMNENRICCPALAAKRLSSMMLGAYTDLVMGPANAYLLTVPGDRDQQCGW